MANGMEPEETGIVPLEKLAELLNGGAQKALVPMGGAGSTDRFRITRGVSRDGTFMAQVLRPGYGPNGQTLRDVIMATLDCGCTACNPTMVGGCPCGCELYVCTKCRKPCQICGVLYYAEHLLVSRRDEKRLVCRTHYSQGC